MCPNVTLTPTARVLWRAGRVSSSGGRSGSGGAVQQYRYQQNSFFFFFILCDGCLLKTEEAKVPEASEVNCERSKRAGGGRWFECDRCRWPHILPPPRSVSQVLVVLSACVEASRLLSKV